MADNSLPKTSTEARKWEIYTLSDPRDGVVWYVGMTHCGRARIVRHLGEAKGGYGSRKCNWLRTLFAENLEPVLGIVELGHGSSWKDAERKWIAFYRTQNPHLTNGTDGGQGPPVGFKMPPKSPETLAKMSAAQRGRTLPPRSADWCRKISEGKKGKPANPEGVAKAAAARRGRKLPAEQFQKMMDGLQRYWNDPQREKHLVDWRGRKHTEASKAKMRAAKIGRKFGPQSAETIEKRIKAQRGKPRAAMSSESRAKQSAALKGKPWSEARRAAFEARTKFGHTEETKAKMRAAIAARKKRSEC